MNVVTSNSRLVSRVVALARLDATSCSFDHGAVAVVHFERASQVFEAWQAWTSVGVFNLLNPDLRPSGITNPQNSS
jgi:hypothetical protein